MRKLQYHTKILRVLKVRKVCHKVTDLFLSWRSFRLFPPFFENALLMGETKITQYPKLKLRFVLKLAQHFGASEWY